MSRGGLLSRLDPDLVIQEAMYGFVMALTLVTTAQLGMFQYDDNMALIKAIIGMDFVWGAIDMIIYYRSDIMSRRRRFESYEHVLKEGSRERKISDLQDGFEGTIFEIASPEVRHRMAEVFVDSHTSNTSDFSKENRHYIFNAVTAFVVSISTVIPSVIILCVESDYTIALFYSAVVSSIALFFIGYWMAPANNLRTRWATGLATAAISLIFTIFAAYLGG